MLSFTGHPLVDVGVAAITALSNKKEPAELNENDLQEAGEFLERVYFDEGWRGVLSVIFQNSAYTQTRIGKQKSEDYIATFLYGWRAPHESDTPCAFCGQPSLVRCFRQHIPLLTGEGILNFFPSGQVGLPVCGRCLLAIQAFLLGSVMCKSRTLYGALFVHSDDDEMTLGFARSFVMENRRSLTLSSVSHPRTYFVARLLQVEAERRQAEEDRQPCSLTLYHLSNFGTKADIELYFFPYQLVSFLRKVYRAPHDIIWRKIERRAWELAIEKVKSKKGNQSEEGETPVTPQPREQPGQARNFLYEDLFDLPHKAARFVRTYFLRRAYRGRFDDDPRRSYKLRRELELVSWTLTAIFLEEVMKMESHRIETIKSIADRLADHVFANDDRKLFRGLSLGSRYAELRRTLTIANLRCVKKGKEPLLNFDDFVTIFEYGENSQRPDWSLARDLVLIRVVEQLHQREWFKDKPDVIDEDMVSGSTEIVPEQS